jgi:DNA repair exonuclease SbcCD nuclease subunit
MKALLVSDLHLRPTHFELAKKVLERIKKELNEKKPEYLIIGGDTFHTKNIVYASMLTLFESFLKEVTKNHKVICLVGNHDWGIQYEVHSLQTLRMDNLIVVDRFYKLENNVGFISYCREKERFESFMNEISDCKILFGHLDLNGFELGSGWEETDAFCGAERFETFKKVFSGHFHKAQEVTLSSGAEIIYVGSSYTTDFSESDQEKRFLLIDLDSGVWDPINTGMTYHKTLKIKATDSLPELNELELKEGVHFRVIISGTKEEIGKVSIPSGYKAKVIFDFQNSESTRADINSYDSHDQMMKKYVEFESKRANLSLEKERLLKIGSAILSKAGILIK